MTINCAITANHQIRHQALSKWAVSLVNADDHFNLPQGVCFDMYGLIFPHVCLRQLREEVDNLCSVLSLDSGTRSR